MPWWQRLLAALPLRFLHALGTGAGWLAYALSPHYRRRLRENASLAGVGLADRRQSVAQAGRMGAETLRLWFRAQGKPIADPLRWEGSEHVQQALAAGRGLVLLAPHMGSFEMAAQAYAQFFGAQQPITVLYRPARHAALRRLVDTARLRQHLFAAPATLGGVRTLLRALKRGQTVGLLPDQVPPEGMGVWAPFFGKPAYTMTLAAKLIRQSGCSVLAIWCERLPGSQGYVVNTRPLPQGLPEHGPQTLSEEQSTLADASAINLNMQAVIALKPSQYLWGYNRYKQPRKLNNQASAEQTP